MNVKTILQKPFDLLSIDEHYVLTNYLSKKYKWEIIEQYTNFIFLSKDKPLFLADEIDIVWNISERILCTVSKHEAKNQYCIKFRKILNVKGLEKIFSYPKTLLPVSVSKSVCTFFVSNKPNTNKLFEYWDSNLVKKYK